MAYPKITIPSANAIFAMVGVEVYQQSQDAPTGASTHHHAGIDLPFDSDQKKNPIITIVNTCQRNAT